MSISGLCRGEQSCCVVLADFHGVHISTSANSKLQGDITERGVGWDAGLAPESLALPTTRKGHTSKPFNKKLHSIYKKTSKEVKRHSESFKHFVWGKVSYCGKSKEVCKVYNLLLSLVFPKISFPSNNRITVD